MALRELRKIGDEILRKKSKTVTSFDERLAILLEDMRDTMITENGIGLAAPQIGVLKRVMIIDTGQGLIEFINPEIMDSEGCQIEEEGCLSVPGVSGKVKRPLKVTVTAYDRKGNLFSVNGVDLMAVAICHEIDHLDGVLFVDKKVDDE